MARIRTGRLIAAAVLCLSFVWWNAQTVRADDYFCYTEISHLAVYQNPEINCNESEALCDAFCDLCWPGEILNYVQHCNSGLSVGCYCTRPKFDW